MLKEREKILRYCSLILILLGANLFIRKRCFIILRTFLRLGFVFNAILSFKSLPIVWKENGFSLTFLASLMYNLVRLTIFAQLIRKRKRLETFVVHCSTLISNQNIHNLSKKILAISLVVVAVQLVDIIFVRTVFVTTRHTARQWFALANELPDLETDQAAEGGNRKK